MILHSINQKQRLYVMPCGSGFSCYGFDVIEHKARAVAAWRTGGYACLDPMPTRGTPQHFEVCAAEIEKGAAHAKRTGFKCDAELTPQLIGLEGKRVEITYPEGHKSRFYVSRSGGWMPCHIEVKTRRSLGGCAAYIPPGASVRVVGAR